MRNPTHPLVLLLAAALMFLPTAAAAGEASDAGGVPPGLILAAYVIGGGLILWAAFAFMGVFKVGKKRNPAGAAVFGGILVISGLAFGGAFDNMAAGPQAASLAGSSPSGTTVMASSAGYAGPWDPLVYEASSDLLMEAQDYETAAAVSPTVTIIKQGLTDKVLVEGSHDKITSKAMSSGAATITVHTQTEGCVVDAHLDVADYYELVARGVEICAPKRAGDYHNDVPVTPFRLKKIGTLSLTNSDASFTCTAGTQCTYVVRVTNSAADTHILSPAVKFTNVDSASLDAEDSDNCEIVEVVGTQYIVFTGPQKEIGPSGMVYCNVKITRTSGDTDGSFNLTADDLFQEYGATGWNTNSAIRGATATSARAVSFA